MDVRSMSERGMNEKVTETHYVVGAGRYQFGVVHTRFPDRGHSAAHSTTALVLGPWGEYRSPVPASESWGLVAGLPLVIMLIGSFIVRRK